MASHTIGLRAMRITGIVQMRMARTRWVREGIRWVEVTKSIDGTRAQTWVQVLAQVLTGPPAELLMSVTVALGIASAGRTTCKATVEEDRCRAVPLERDKVVFERFCKYKIWSPGFGEHVFPDVSFCLAL